MTGNSPAIFRPGVLRFAAVPGSYNAIVGTFPEGFVPDLRVGTIPAVILWRSSSEIAIQIPWEVEPDDPGTPNLTPIMLGTPEPLWEQVAGSGVYSVAGAFFPIAVAGLRVAYYALHGDWSGPITPANPASRGELIHIYGTGYGPVDSKVPTGKPTPSDGPHRISTLCVWKARSEQNETSRTINVAFAGLAPGTTGIYQFDIRIPSDWPSSVFNAFCEIAPGLVLPTAPIFSVL